MKLIKNSIKRLFNHLGYEFARYDPIKDTPFDLLNVLIERMRTVQSKIFFIQIGANNGIMGDPLFDLVKKYHFQGLLIEPLSKQFKELRNNYKDETQLIFENCAISEKKSTRLMFQFTQSPRVPDWAYGMASFNKNHLTKFKDTACLSDFIEEITVPTMSMNDLFAKHSIENIDLLQIDTEGYDFEIIKMLFKTQLRPFIINYEHEHLSSKKHIACKRLLIENNYNFITYGRDILAIHSSFESKIITKTEYNNAQ